MNINDVKELLEKVDIHYGTNYSRVDLHIKEWHKELKKYDKEDVFRKLEEHLRGNFSNTPPKLYFLIKDLKKPEDQIKLEKLLEKCNICGEYIKLTDFDKHYDRCLQISFIERNVKKYFNQQIIKSDYYAMSDEDLTKRFDKISKVVLEKDENNQIKSCLKNYFKTKGEIYEK